MAGLTTVANSANIPKNTAVSSTRLPPPPNALKQTNKPRTSQFGAAPATIANTLHTSRLTLKAILRPMISAVMPQNSAPTSMPTYTAIVNPLGYPGENSSAAGAAMMD
jgi:hypothetical protein